MTRRGVENILYTAEGQPDARDSIHVYCSTPQYSAEALADGRVSDHWVMHTRVRTPLSDAPMRDRDTQTCQHTAHVDTRRHRSISGQHTAVQR
eukprot:1371759-Rhodomonas_salina.1